jgi:hypothetical protein
MNLIGKKSFWNDIILFFTGMLISCSSSMHKSQCTMIKKPEDSRLLTALITGDKWLADSILQKKEQLNIQVIYTQIDRNEKRVPVFVNHYFNVDTARYFYPASTVKLPVALLALQRLHELKGKGIDKNTAMITEAEDSSQTVVRNDLSSADGNPSVAHYIKKILLVSDNDAFNRLYEFLGQEYINTRLTKMGYKDAQIIHRLSQSLTEDQNRHTNPVKFLDKNGAALYSQPAQKSKWTYRRQEIKLGAGYMKGNELVHEPFDFSGKNKISLAALHEVMQGIIFPETMPAKKRFGLTPDDYSFLYKYLSMYPRESDFPYYNKVEYPDTYVKKFISGDDTMTSDPDIRIFNKSGTAYGFLTDIAYIVDYKNQVEFFLSATIYCNSDGIFNDDHYDYDLIGYPFFRQLGKVVYEYELKRERRNVPGLSKVRY